MKTRKIIFQYSILIALTFAITNVKGDESWVAYSNKIETKDFTGCKFRLSALIRTEIADDSSAASIWAREDKKDGFTYFKSKQKQSVRTNEWKSFSIEGKLDSTTLEFAFGVKCEYNGKFYFDDIIVEIEKSNKWIPVFTSDFDNEVNVFEQGLQRWTNGFNANYSAHIISNQKTKDSKFLMIEGKNVPIFGVNTKVGKYAFVNGINLYYEIYGQGIPLLVLHGNGGSIADATPFYNSLIKKYKVITIDSRSQGKSGGTKEELNYDTMTSDIYALLELLKIDSALVWGQSDGAILGLILAMDYPKKVRKLLSFGANIQPDSSAIFQWDIDYCKKIAAESPSLIERKLNILMLKYPTIPFSKLAKIKAPVLIMAGDRDLIRPEHTLKLFQSIPNSQLCIIPGSSHGAAWEKSELFSVLMNDFFDQPFNMPDSKQYLNE